MPYTNELWKSRYPALTGILDDDPGVPKRNVFVRNISAGGRWDDIAAPIRQHQTVENNLAFDADPGWIEIRRDSEGRPQQLVFKDAAAVKAIGFEPLPLGKMGLVADPRRASWPVRRTVRRIVFPPAKVVAARPRFKSTGFAVGCRLDVQHPHLVLAVMPEQVLW